MIATCRTWDPPQKCHLAHYGERKGTKNNINCNNNNNNNNKKDLKKSVRELVRSERSTAVLGRMQKSVVSSSLKIARSLKIMG